MPLSISVCLSLLQTQFADPVVVNETSQPPPSLPPPPPPSIPHESEYQWADDGGRQCCWEQQQVELLDDNTNQHALIGQNGMVNGDHDHDDGDPPFSVSLVLNGEEKKEKGKVSDRTTTCGCLAIIVSVCLGVCGYE